MNLRLSLLLLSLSQIQVGFALTHSRAYQWGFQSPNLAPNWSFENPLEFWWEESHSGVTANTRYKAAGTPAVSAKTGSFVAVVSGNSSTTDVYLSSERFRINPSTAYTLSFYFRTSGTISGSVTPSVGWYPSPGVGGNGSFTGTPLTTASGWTLYTQTFTTPANAGYLSISLAKYNAGASGTIYFDNVVVEEGALTSTQVSANRQQITQSIAYGDALGRVLETQDQIDPAGTRYLVNGVGFDEFARPESTFLATPKNITTPAPMKWT
jgi:hypothetical protein